MVDDLVTLMDKASRGLGWNHHYRSDSDRMEWRSGGRKAHKERFVIVSGYPNKAEKEEAKRIEIQRNKHKQWMAEQRKFMELRKKLGIE